MINKNFYPTPTKIIKKMVDTINLRHIKKNKIRILDPSGGKGDILDYIKETNEYRHLDLYCIEIESELAAILRDKGYKYIHNDFLNYTPDSSFDVIVMNPPFDTCDKHFIKAWEIATDTEIRCLFPKNMLKNSNTTERKLVKNIIKDNNGTITDFGRCFKFAERKTNVEVVMISIRKEDKTEFNYKFTKYQDQEKKYSIGDTIQNGIATTDVFSNMEIRYNTARQLIAQLIALRNELEYYVGDMVDVNQLIQQIVEDRCSESDKETYDNMSDTLRESAWKSIFTQTKMTNLVTTKTRKKIDIFQQQQGCMAFTANNMLHLYDDLFQNAGTIMQDCVVESFDLLTKYHKENRCYKEGWKTNERFFVNKKFILPNSIDTDYINFSDYVYIHTSRKNDITDIEKSLCFIIGKKFETIESIERMFLGKKITDFGKWYDSEFLEFKCFKKGTMHFKFKSESLWNNFNLTACKGKNWIGM